MTTSKDLKVAIDRLKECANNHPHVNGTRQKVYDAINGLQDCTAARAAADTEQDDGQDLTIAYMKGFADGKRAAISQPAKEQEPEGLTSKQAWWAGYRAGKGLPPDTPRQEAIAAPVQQEAKPEDRKMLETVSQDLEISSWQCPRCGHAEDCKTMDVASMLRDYLAPQAEAHKCHFCGGTKFSPYPIEGIVHCKQCGLNQAEAQSKADKEAGE